MAIDTGSGTSVAAGELIHHNFVLRALSKFDDPFGHAENIGNALREALETAGWGSDQQLVLVANQGPAGYTGLRVGLAAATAFAATRDVPLLGVSSLAAAAFGFFKQFDRAQECSVALEAKRSEVFFQHFRRDQKTPLPVATASASLMPIGQLPQPLPADWTVRAPDASIVAELGAMLWLREPNAIGVSAQYLRQPDVTPGSGKRVSG